MRPATSCPSLQERRKAASATVSRRLSTRHSSALRTSSSAEVFLSAFFFSSFLVSCLGVLSLSISLPHAGISNERRVYTSLFIRDRNDKHSFAPLIAFAYSSPSTGRGRGCRASI